MAEVNKELFYYSLESPSYQITMTDLISFYCLFTLPLYETVTNKTDEKSKLIRNLIDYIKVFWNICCPYVDKKKQACFKNVPKSWLRIQ